jgi:2-dehydro-3-deoxygalactonokinase
MIGSTFGWVEAPYRACPASLSDLIGSLVHAQIGGVDCRIVPGLATDARRDDPDVMRGEEMEIFGVLTAEPALVRDITWFALPGTHTKWVRVEGARIVDFFSSMSGELYDRLIDKGMLASVIEGEARVGEVFMRGVRRGASEGRGFGRLLFSVRASVIRGRLPRSESASYARGLLIGAEIADALGHEVTDALRAPLWLLGNPALCALYAAGLAHFGIESRIYNGADALSAGFRALDAFAQEALK